MGGHDNKIEYIRQMAETLYEVVHLLGVQRPFPVDGDSVYEKDIDLSRSTKDGWEGEVDGPFKDLYTSLHNDTVTNPKVLMIYFNRTLYLNAIGLGCNCGKTFSNVKIEFIGSGNSVRYTHDQSGDSTKYTSKLFQFRPTACIGIKLSFYTADSVGLTNITIQKEVNVVVRPHVPSSIYQAGMISELVVKIGDGELKGIILSGIINNANVTLYDDVKVDSSSPVIWSSGDMANQTRPFSVEFFDMPFETGLSLSIENAACNVLLTYE